MNRIMAAILAGIMLFNTTAFAAPAQEEAVISEDVKFWSEVYGKGYGICPEVIQAICWTESRCNPEAKSGDGSCRGLMQIHVASHRKRMERLNVTDIYSVPGNIRVGVDYLAELSETEPIAAALARYNGQSDEKVEKARKGIYSGYVDEVLTLAEELERRNGK